MTTVESQLPPRPKMNGVNALGPAATRVPLAIAQFVAFAAVARAVGELAFGLVVFTQTAARLAAALCMRGGGPLMLQRFAREPIDVARKALRSEVRSSSIAIPVFVVVLVALESLIFKLSIPQIGLLTGLVLVFLAAAIATRLGSESVKGLGRPTRAQLWEFLPGPIALLSIAWFLRSPSAWSGLAVLAVLVGAQLVSAIGLLFIEAKAHRVTRAANEDLAKPAKAGNSRLHLSVSTVVTLALPLAALGAAAAVGDGEAVGRLSACLRLLAPATIVISGIAAALLPRIARDEGPKPLRVSWVLVAGLSIPYSLVLLAFPQIAEVIFGPEFSGLENVVRVLAIAQLLNGATGIGVEVLQITGRVRAESRVVITAAFAATIAVVIAWSAGGVDAPLLGALFFAAVLGSRSLAAGGLVYLPLAIGSAGRERKL